MSIPRATAASPVREPRVAIALYPGMLSSGITLPLDLFSAAAQRLGLTDDRVKPQLAAATLEPISLRANVMIMPTCHWSDLQDLDFLLLPAIWRHPVRTLRRSQPLLGVLRALWEQGTQICAVGTASYLLAEAGLLNQRPATTHWYYCKDFQRRYPQVQLRMHHLITHADRLYCSGSINAMVDLLLFFIEQYAGAEVARHVQSQFSPEVRQSLGRARLALSGTLMHHDELVRDAQRLVIDNMRSPPSLAQMASRMGISERTLARRFRQAVGMSPGQYVRSQRLLHARDLLQQSNLSIAEVAWQVGLPDISHFTRLFRAEWGLPPAQFRRSVRAKLFDVQS